MTLTRQREAPTRKRRLQRRRVPGWFFPVAVIAVLLIAGGLLLSQVSNDTDRPRYEIVAAENRIINQDGLINAHNSPTVVQNPTNPNNLVVADRVDRPLRSGSLHVSHDLGQTWKDVALNLPPGGDLGFAPELFFDSRGQLTVAFVTIPRGGAVPTGVWVETSTDGGHTLGPPVRALGPFALQVRLTGNPADGRLHLTWLQADQAGLPPACLPCFSRTGLPIMSATSSDGGRTWSRPVRVSDEGRARVGAASPVVAPDGTVYVLYQDFKDDRDDWENLNTAPYKGSFELVLTKSTDQGRTFPRGTVVDADIRTLERFLVFFPKYPSLAVSPEGEIYAAWQDARRGDFDVMLRRSSDGGQTWNGPIRVNDDPAGNGRHQYLPTVSASTPGRVDIVYYDRRDDPRNILTGAYFGTSFNRGEDWQAVPVSDQLFDSRIGPGSERRNPDPGAKLGLVSLADGAYAVWTDSRKGSLDTDRQDIAGGKVVISRKS